MAGAAGAVCFALAFGAGTAHAQSQGSLDVVSEPVINGTAIVGQTLTPSGGAWRSPNPEPSRTEAWWQWMRCPNPEYDWRCRFLTRNPSHTVTSADLGNSLFVIRYVRWRDTKNTPQTNDDTYQTDWRASRPSVRVTSPPPAPTPTPTPTPTPAPPPASFDTVVPVATPVPTSGEVLQQTANKRRVIRPFPVVRMRGRLTSNGADVTLLSIRAPKAARISLHCKGKCPTKRWTRTERKRKLTRVSPFERTLKAGTRITITVFRPGYVGKRTTFVIRRGFAPTRTDRCINSKGRTTRCPAGV